MESNAQYSEVPAGDKGTNINLKNIGNPALQKLRGNLFLKITGGLFGCVIPLVSLLGLSMFSFGSLSLSSDKNECFSVEYPDTNVFKANPVETDPKNYMGLEVVNVTSRFYNTAFYGFLIETAIFAFVVLGFIFGRRIHICSDILGYFSLAWFIRLLFVRYDHFGQVCTSSSNTDFPNLV